MGCIGLRFQGILKNFFMTKQYAILSIILKNINKSCGFLLIKTNIKKYV